MGAGTEAGKARRLVDDNVTPGQLHEHVLAAQAILLAVLFNEPGQEDEPGKTTAAETETGDSPLP